MYLHVIHSLYLLYASPLDMYEIILNANGETKVIDKNV